MIDYKELGLKVGLEIHAQLDTFKLFCNCFSTMDEEVRKTIVRKLHPVPGETGEVDIAAQHEFEKGREFYYQVFNDTTCLVESDDEPPRGVNMQALDIAVTLANMFNCYIPDEIHFMRKTVIDGSNTSGFQRTGIIGLNGYIKTSFGKVRITNLQLEEDACGIVSKHSDHVIYRMDRLGIPLVEIGTGPDAHSPKEAQELAETIGMYLKSTGKIKKGLNAIRQDINVSIKGGARVEIKGVQSLSGIPKAVEMEVERQLNLIKLKDWISKLRFSNIEDVSDTFSNSKCKLLRGKKVFALRISHGKGLLATKIQGDKTLGRELADYVKAKTDAKGFIHTDEDLAKYNISEEEINAVASVLKCQSNDLIALVSDFPKALEKIIERLTMFSKGVPEEVRRFNEDGTTTYMRPMPGRARMYPETDVKPIVMKIKKVKTPTLISDRIKRLKKKYGLSEDVAKALLRSNYFEIFEMYAKYNPKFIASVVTSYLRDAEKRRPLDVEDVKEILNLWRKGKISKDGVQDLIKEVSEGKDLMEVYESKYKSKIDLEKVIDKIVKEKREFVLKNKERAIKPLMGLVMEKVRGRFPGDKIYKLLKERIDIECGD